jgi:hypothetical protein
MKEPAAEQLQWCPGSYKDAPNRGGAACPECGLILRVVGRAVMRGWGRSRFPRHKRTIDAALK